MSDNGSWRRLFRRHELPPASSDSGLALTFRYAYADDQAELERLAELDSQTLPDGPLLVAEVAGELWAAVGLAGSEAIANPFRPTGELVWMLCERAAQLRRAGQPDPAVAFRLLMPRCPEPAWFGRPSGAP